MLSLLLLMGAASCPWFNAATVQGILKEPVTATFTQEVCEFAGRHATLRIQVTTMTDVPRQFAAYLAGCGKAPEHLRGIGNDAVACGAGATSAEVISRVRERALLVKVTSTEKSADRKQLAEQARTAAEQVAGNLF